MFGNMMFDDLVVVATNNGGDMLKKCADSLGNTYPVLYLDTGSNTDEMRRAFFVNTEGKMRAVMPFKGYTTGAYLWAYWNYAAKNYFFMQDSMVALEKNYLDKFKESLPEMGVSAWALFEEGFDSIEQEQWAHYIYNSDPDSHEVEHKYPGTGIFGPVFYIGAEAMNTLTYKNLLPPIPITKYQAQGTERLWAWSFAKAGIKVNSVGGMWDGAKMQAGEYPIFKKIFADRK